MADDDLFGVLHTLRIVGFGDTPLLSSRLGAEPVVVEAALRSAESALLVTYRAGRMTGWSLTVAGRSHGESLLAAEVDRLGARDAVWGAYERFRGVNQRFLDLCTDWQLLPGEVGARRVNDHRDAAYDADVIGRLGALDAVIQPVLLDLGAAVARFANYPDRLTTARRMVEVGDRDWFTRPVIDSYHSVWFELHEDLLATLGLRRATEHPSSGESPR